MTATSLKQESSHELQQLFQTLAGSIAETLSSLVGREIRVQADGLQVHDGQAIVGALPRPGAIARGALDGDYEGKTMLTLFELPDAVAMSGLLMMTPEDVINQRRAASNMQGEDAEAFGELGTVIYSGFANTLRAKVDDIDVKMLDHGVVAPGAASSLLQDGRMVALGFRMKVGEYPESIGLIAIDLETAEKWNKGPIELAGAEPRRTGNRASPTRFDDDGLESIPEAPIRGVTAAFVTQTEIMRLLCRSCRRVGLELQRHGKGEIPNPAAHRDQIVVLDVPPGEDRRFDWCRRIKDLSETTRVVLLIQHPSRQRVTQAFLSRADAILGFPCEEAQLSQKLGQLIPDQPLRPPTPPGSSTDG